MKKTRIYSVLVLFVALLSTSCGTFNKTQKGAAAGTVAGGGMGAIIGRATGNTALGAIIGAAVGGASGAVIGHQMDKQAEEIENNIPDAKVERVGEGIVVEFSSNVLFGFDESDLTIGAAQSLDKLVSVLNVYPDTDIEIQGHTDSKGSVSYNQALSERRARKVSNYLVNHGIGYNRASIKGFGERMPKYDNSTLNGQSQNRRVEFLISANETMKAAAEKDALK